MKQLLIPIIAIAVIVSCGKNNNAEQNNNVLSAEEQARLTPAQVIENLKKGNKEYASNQLTVRNNTERISNAVSGQFPQAVILSCLDSRVPVEDVFHCAIGDIFVARVAGNIVNADILGSMEFACKASGAKLVLVLGHESCGAIKHAIDNTELGNITEMLSKIKPAVAQSRTTFSGEASSKNAAFVEHVCQTNVELMIQEIRAKSPVLKEMEDNGEIKIVGGIYSLQTGKVDFLEVTN